MAIDSENNIFNSINKKATKSIVWTSWKKRNLNFVWEDLFCFDVWCHLTLKLLVETMKLATLTFRSKKKDLFWENRLSNAPNHNWFPRRIWILIRISSLGECLEHLNYRFIEKAKNFRIIYGSHSYSTINHMWHHHHRSETYFKQLANKVSV